MAKYLIALAIAGAMSTATVAQTTPQANTAEAQSAKAEMVKKRVCSTQVDRLHNVHKVCKTIAVPAHDPTDAAQAPDAQTGGN